MLLVLSVLRLTFLEKSVPQLCGRTYNMLLGISVQQLCSKTLSYLSREPEITPRTPSASRGHGPTTCMDAHTLKWNNNTAIPTT